MQKNLLFLAAALVGIGAAVWLFAPGDGAVDRAPVVAPAEAEVQAADDERRPTRSASVERRNLDDEERYVHPAAEEAAERLERPFGQFALAAAPQWNAIAYELRGADRNEDLAAACKEMTGTLRELRRAEDPDVAGLLVEQQALLERVRAEAGDLASIQPSVDKLVTLLAELAHGGSGDEALQAEGEPGEIPLAEE